MKPRLMHPLRIVVAGATGMIGSALVSYLTKAGHEVIALQRQNPEEPYFWNPQQGSLKGSLEGCDALINLAGYPVVQKRWTAAIKNTIWSSRVDTTRFLVDAMKTLKKPPKVFVSASATGFYGHADDLWLSEDHPSGSGFLAEVCQAWEREALEAEKLGVRVAIMRFGVVLTPKGGALKMMLPIFKWGLGGKLGTGEQWMSWISLDDAVGFIHFALTHDIRGPLNAVSPNPVTNKEFTSVLAKALNRPAFCHVPAPILRLISGEVANETVLCSTHASSAKIQKLGYTFHHPNLESLFPSGK